MLRRTGSILATGSAMTIDNDAVGFRPTQVTVINTTSRDGFEWTDTMADASALKTVAAGTRTFATTNGITPTATGFILGADSDVNAAGETLHFVALG